MATRLSVSATTTTAVTTSLKATPKAKQMLAERCIEAVELNAKKREIDARLDRLKDEVKELFKKEKQTDALCDGTKVNGYSLKLVCGKGKRLNKSKLIELGCEPEWLEEATEDFDKKPYIKITAPGAKGEDDDDE